MVSVFDLERPFAVVLIVAALGADTRNVLTAKLPELFPAGITMLLTAGEAHAGFELDRLTVMFPGPAAHSSVTTPDTGRPPWTGFGVRATLNTEIGRSVRLSVPETP